MDKDAVVPDGETVECEFTATPEDAHRRATVVCTDQRVVILRRNKYANIDRRSVEVVEVERTPELNQYTLAGGALLAVAGVVGQALSSSTVVVGSLALGALLVGGGMYLRRTTLTISTGSNTYTLQTRDHDKATAAAALLQTTPPQSTQGAPRQQVTH